MALDGGFLARVGEIYFLRDSWRWGGRLGLFLVVAPFAALDVSLGHDDDREPQVDKDVLLGLLEDFARYRLSAVDPQRFARLGCSRRRLVFVCVAWKGDQPERQKNVGRHCLLLWVKDDPVVDEEDDVGLAIAGDIGNSHLARLPHGLFLILPPSRSVLEDLEARFPLEVPVFEDRSRGGEDEKKAVREPRE